VKSIVPNLWFDNKAKEAAWFYAELFPKAQITNVTTLDNTPSGETEIVSFVLANQPFMAFNAGPLFDFNPSISFILNFDPSNATDAKQELDRFWERLTEDGTVLMPLQTYPFSKRYGWIQDKFGVSWQLILSDPAGEERPFIVPSLMFAGDVAGKAFEAINFYVAVFAEATDRKLSKIGSLQRYPAGMEPDKEGTLMFADFMLLDQWHAAMDSARRHDFTFNEAISLMVECETQGEIDYLWSKLSADSKAEQCGWLKDKYGVSWQIVPTLMQEMLEHGSRKQISRVTQAFLQMKKFDIALLQQAYEGKQ
jgi:predicted 3-demethylubiquinone-9 3-methyltransferase (glyoxalase superfamily)